MQIDFFLHMRSPSHLHWSVSYNLPGRQKLCLPSISKMAYTLLVKPPLIEGTVSSVKNSISVSVCLFSRLPKLSSHMLLYNQSVLSGFTEFYEHSENSNLPYIARNHCYIQMCFPEKYQEPSFFGPFSRNLLHISRASLCCKCSLRILDPPIGRVVWTYIVGVSRFLKINSQLLRVQMIL